MTISIDSCCCCIATEDTPLTTFFSRVTIIPIPLHLLGKELGIHRQFYPPISGYNKYQYTNLWTDQQAYSIDYGKGFYTYWSKQWISIDNFTWHMPIGQTIGIDRQFHVPIGHSNKYRSTIWHTYCKNNSLLYQFLWTYWSKQ